MTDEHDMEGARNTALRLSPTQQNFLLDHDPDYHLRPICNFPPGEDRTRVSLLNVGLIRLHPPNAIRGDKTKLTETGFYVRLQILALMADRLMANGYEVKSMMEIKHGYGRFLWPHRPRNERSVAAPPSKSV